MFYFRTRPSKKSYLGAALLGLISGALLWELFGERIKRRARESEKFQELKRNVYDKAGRMKDLTREQYDRIVEETSDKYGRLKGISQNELRDMMIDLKGHWYRIKDAWNKPHGPGSDDEDASLTQAGKG